MWFCCNKLTGWCNLFCHRLWWDSHWWFLTSWESLWDIPVCDHISNGISKSSPHCFDHVWHHSLQQFCLLKIKIEQMQHKWNFSNKCALHIENLTHTVFVKDKCTPALEKIFCSELPCYSISAPQHSTEFYAWHRIDDTLISYVRYDFTILDSTMWI